MDSEEEGCQEGPKGFGPRKWKNSVAITEALSLLSWEGGLWQVPGMDEEKDPDLGPFSFQKTQPKRREGRGGEGGRSSRWRVPGCGPSRPATHLACPGKHTSCQ